MTWRPDTLLEVLAAGEEIALATDRHGRYACPNCGVHRHAAVIVDVRALPIPEEWACDACWTMWQRQLRDVDGLGPVTDRRAWTIRWATALNAPLAVIEKLQD